MRDTSTSMFDKSLNVVLAEGRNCDISKKSEITKRVERKRIVFRRFISRLRISEFFVVENSNLFTRSS